MEHSIQAIKKSLYNPIQNFSSFNEANLYKRLHNHQYKRIFKHAYEKAMYRYLIYDSMKNASNNKQKVLAFLFSASNSFRKVCFSKKSIAITIGCSVKTVERVLKELRDSGLISWKSGKKEKKTNVYFLNRIMFHKKAKMYLWRLLRGHWFTLIESRCRTIFKKIIYTYRKLITLPKKLIEKISNSPAFVLIKTPHPMPGTQNAENFKELPKNLIQHCDQTPKTPITSPSVPSQPIQNPRLYPTFHDNKEGNLKKDVNKPITVEQNPIWSKLKNKGLLEACIKFGERANIKINK